MAHEPNRTGLPSEPPSRTPSIDELQSEAKGCCCRGWTLFWNRFSQQRLKGYTPIWTVHSVVMLYLVLGIIFLPVGIALLLASLGVETQDMRYDNVGPFANLSSSERQALLQQQGGEGLPITFEMRIEADMDPPVYMYIQLHDFHQNVRRYVRSMNSKQIHGEDVSAGDLTACRPQRFLDLPEEQRANLTDEGLINPCGLIAWSQLNDTVDSLSITEGGLGAPRPLPFDETGISWSTDREWLFGNYNATNYNTVPSLRGGATIDGPVNTEEHLLVWMRVAARPRARKLYAVIDDKLREGDVLRINMTNRYNTYDFSGKKAVFLTTTSWAGGRSILLGVLWIAAGSFWVMSAAALTLWNSRWPRAYGDLNLLSWRKAA